MASLNMSIKIDGDKYKKGLDGLYEVLKNYNITPDDTDKLSKIIIDMTLVGGREIEVEDGQ